MSSPSGGDRLVEAAERLERCAECGPDITGDHFPERTAAHRLAARALRLLSEVDGEALGRLSRDAPVLLGEEGQARAGARQWIERVRAFREDAGDA